MLAARVDGVWLYHDDGWLRYPMVNFHRRSLAVLVRETGAAPFKAGIDILCSVNAALHAVKSPWRIDVKDGQAIAVPTPDVHSSFVGETGAVQPAKESK